MDHFEKRDALSGWGSLYDGKGYTSSRQLEEMQYRLDHPIKWRLEKLFRKKGKKAHPVVMKLPDREGFIKVVVKRGDSLWTISKASYKEGKFYTVILRDNPQITNPQLLYVGQEIYIRDRIPQFITDGLIRKRQERR